MRESLSQSMESNHWKSLYPTQRLRPYISPYTFSFQTYNDLTIQEKLLTRETPFSYVDERFDQLSHQLVLTIPVFDLALIRHVQKRNAFSINCADAKFMHLCLNHCLDVDLYCFKIVWSIIALFRNCIHPWSASHHWQLFHALVSRLAVVIHEKFYMILSQNSTIGLNPVPIRANGLSRE